MTRVKSTSQLLFQSLCCHIQAKRQRTRYPLRGRQPASESEEIDPSEFDSLSPPPVSFKPTRRRLSHAASDAAAAAAVGGSSVSCSEEDEWLTCSSSETGGSSDGTTHADAGGKVVLSKDMCLLFDDKPSGPLVSNKIKFLIPVCHSCAPRLCIPLSASLS